MATQWSEIYSQVCSVLLESPDGLSLGLLTEGQFLTLAGETLTDLASKTGLIRKIFNTVIGFGVSTYPLDDNLSDLQACIAQGTHIFETSDFMLSNYNDDWATWMNRPEAYKQDDIDPRSVLLEPIPNIDGDQVVVDSGSGAYGTISSTSSPVDFDIEASFLTPAGYGTIATGLGNPYLETVNPGYGLIAAMVPSGNNLSKFGTALPANIANLSLDSYIELIPDSLVHYLKYGILAKIFSSDNELRDEQKAAYSAARYSECINLIGAMMDMEYQEN